MKGKKLLAAILCVAMLLTLFSGTAFAQGEIYNETQATSYGTIKEAIVAADEGDVITLGEGTYELDATVAISKSITLKGAGKDKTTIQYENAGYLFSLGGTDQDFTFEGITFAGASKDAGTGFKIASSVKAKSLTITNCAFEKLMYGIYNGDNYAKDGYTNEVNITGSSFDCGLVGVYFERIDNLTATGNTFTGASQAGLQIYAPLNTDAEIAYIRLTNNTFNDNPGYPFSLDFFNSTKVGELTVTGNTGSGNMIRDGVATNVARYRVGAEAMPNIQDVTFEKNEMGVLEMGHVYNETKDAYYDTISQAIADAQPKDVLVLGAETYKENITVDKELTIKGPEQGTALIQFDPATRQSQEYFEGRIAYPTVFATAALTLENVTIAGPTDQHHGIDGILAKSDLTLTGVTIRDIRCTADGGFICGVQYGRGVMVDGSGDVTIKDSTIVDFQKQAIDLNTTGTVVIDNNTITGVGEQAIIGQNGIVIRKGTATVTNNVISGMKYNAENEWANCSIGIYGIGDAKLNVKGNTVKDIDNTFAVDETATAELEENTLLAPVINYRTDDYQLDVSRNYWGSEEPDFETLFYGNVVENSYYADEEMTELIEKEPPVKDVSYVCPKTGVSLNADTTVVPEGSYLIVTPIVQTEEAYMKAKEALKNKASSFVLYDIILVNASGDPIQPEGKVVIGIPTPDGYDTSKLEVYRLDDGVIAAEYSVTAEGEMAYFQTDHFSEYALAVQGTMIDDSEQDGEGTKPETKPEDKPKEEIPGTNDSNDGIAFYMLVAVVAAGAAMVLLIRVLAKKRYNN